jgi:hypothetical protein
MLADHNHRSLVLDLGNSPDAPLLVAGGEVAVVVDA